MLFDPELDMKVLQGADSDGDSIIDYGEERDVLDDIADQYYANKTKNNWGTSFSSNEPTAQNGTTSNGNQLTKRPQNATAYNPEKPLCKQRSQ